MIKVLHRIMGTSSMNCAHESEHSDSHGYQAYKEVLKVEMMS